MWLISTHGFVSVVQDRKDKNILQVRARVADDISAMFPDAKVYISQGGDYRYRARIPRNEVALRLAEHILDEVTYTSHFKDVALRTAPPNKDRCGAFYATWTAMARMQDYAPYSRYPRGQEPPRSASNWPTSWKGSSGSAHFGGSRSEKTPPPLPTFSEAKNIPGSPWRETSGSASKVERSEAAREPEVWEVDRDLPDAGEWDYPDIVLDAVEEAFGVNADTLTDEELEDFVDILRSMNLVTDEMLDNRSHRDATDDEELLDRIIEARDAGTIVVPVAVDDTDADTDAVPQNGLVVPIKTSAKKRKPPYVNNPGNRRGANKRR